MIFGAVAYCEPERRVSQGWAAPDAFVLVPRPRFRGQHLGDRAGAGARKLEIMECGVAPAAFRSSTQTWLPFQSLASVCRVPFLADAHESGIPYSRCRTANEHSGKYLKTNAVSLDSVNLRSKDQE